MKKNRLIYHNQTCLQNIPGNILKIECKFKNIFNIYIYGFVYMNKLWNRSITFSYIYYEINNNFSAERCPRVYQSKHLLIAAATAVIDNGLNISFAW